MKELMFVRSSADDGFLVHWLKERHNMERLRITAQTISKYKKYSRRKIDQIGGQTRIKTRGWMSPSGSTKADNSLQDSKVHVNKIWARIFLFLFCF